MPAATLVPTVVVNGTAVAADAAVPQPARVWIVRQLEYMGGAEAVADVANYALSLWVLAMALTWRARAALVKGASMLAFGVFVVGRVAWGAWQGTAPEPFTMGTIIKGSGGHHHRSTLRLIYHEPPLQHHLNISSVGRQ